MRKTLLRLVALGVLGMVYWYISSPDVVRAGSQCDPDCALVGMSCCGDCWITTEAGGYEIRICNACC